MEEVAVAAEPLMVGAVAKVMVALNEALVEMVVGVNRRRLGLIKFEIYYFKVHKIGMFQMLKFCICILHVMYINILKYNPIYKQIKMLVNCKFAVVSYLTFVLALIGFRILPPSLPRNHLVKKMIFYLDNAYCRHYL